MVAPHVKRRRRADLKKAEEAEAARLAEIARVAKEAEASRLLVEAEEKRLKAEEEAKIAKPKAVKKHRDFRNFRVDYPEIQN